MSDKLNVTARVRIVVDIPASPRWNNEVTARDIIGQASRETLRAVKDALRGLDPTYPEEPVVTMVIAAEEPKS